tara:strand:- start:11875 stop:12654 length:780 start_codon:yes stop_codon:yes gene_type:complete
MKFIVKGKELKEAITVCKLKGKYNEGNSSSNSLLCDDVMLEVKGGNLYIQNADNYTYVVYRLECDILTGTTTNFTVSGSTLSKYLIDTNVTITTLDDKIEVYFNDTVVSMPLLERHSNASIITRLKEYLMDLDKRTISKVIREGKTIQATPKLHLSTIIKICSEEFSEAMSLAEKVGNSIYSLDWGDEGLLVSSMRDNEKVTTNILPITNCGGFASVDISLPISNICKAEDEIILAFGDDVPVVFVNSKITILRGPRER